MKKANKKSVIRIFVVSVILAVAVLLVTFFCSLKVEMSGTDKQTDSIIVNITPDSTVKNISGELDSNGIIKYSSVFRLYLKLKNFDGSITAGLHQVSDSMSYKELAEELTGAPYVDAVSVTIPEGYEFDMIAKTFAENGLVDYDKFCEIAENYDFDYDFVDMIPDREVRLEGYLFPDTYFVTENDDEIAIISMMLDRFEQNFSDKYINRASELGMTVDQVVNLASIIQREAANISEMKDVSSVFHNRLQSEDWPYLQSCATVQYILDERKPVLTNEDTQINSPYNTYINKGLPLGPIASPGSDAIKAALYPSNTNYYFFVAGPDGKTIFSETFDEHVNAAY